MTRLTPIHRSLLGNLSLVIILLSSAIITMTFLGSQRTVRTLSRSLIRQTIEETEVRLQLFFDPVVRGLYLTRSWGESGLLHTTNPRPSGYQSCGVLKSTRGAKRLMPRVATRTMSLAISAP